MTAAVDLGLVLREAAWLWLLVPVLLAVGCGWLRRDGACFAAFGLLRSRAAPPLPGTWRLRLAWLPFAVEAFALLCLVVALARPVHVEVDRPERLGRDILLCCDRSSSMAALDLDPARSRLEVGKQVAAEFVAGREHDRIGFVTFARFVDLRCPPTADRQAVQELLQRIELVAADGDEDATAIGGAVAAAAAALERSAAAGRVVVLLTDGEENVGVAGADGEIPPLHAAQWCKERSIRVHSIVLGTGARQPDGSFAPLDTTAVQQLAEVTGGRFFTAADAGALRAVYREIDALEAALFAEPGLRVTEWFVVPVVLGLLSWFAAQFLRRGPAWGCA
jgi:Ca-activated chloride channel homolog